MPTGSEHPLDGPEERFAQGPDEASIEPTQFDEEEIEPEGDLVYAAYEVSVARDSDDWEGGEQHRTIDPPGFHTVRQSESLLSLGEMYRIPWRKIWFDAKNAALRQRRNPDMLMPGDQLYIPERICREEAVETEARHLFCYKRPMCWCRIVMRDVSGRPRPNLKITLHIHGLSHAFEGETDSQGLFQCVVPADRTSGLLLITDPESREHSPEAYDLRMHGLDPLDEQTGVAARLSNLGYLCGPVAGEESEGIDSAVRALQIDCELPPNGQLDEQTRELLRKKYGC